MCIRVSPLGFTPGWAGAQPVCAPVKRGRRKCYAGATSVGYERCSEALVVCCCASGRGRIEKVKGARREEVQGACHGVDAIGNSAGLTIVHVPRFVVSTTKERRQRNKRNLENMVRE
jgi:hypothetical protein